MRLLISGNHRLLVDALSMALTDNGHTVVATALDRDEAVEAAREHQPDACLLDVNFPHANGLGAIGRIHQVSPDTRVVILSGSISGGLVADAIAEGALGVVGKEKPVGAIIEALELAQQGHLAVDPLLLQEALRPHGQDDDPLWVLKFLTEREWAVMRCIMDGLSTKQMADQLSVHRSTVRTHVQHLLTKLGVHSRLQAAMWMTAHASTETRPNLVIGVDAAAAHDDRVADAVEMGVGGWVAKHGGMDSLPVAVQGAAHGETHLPAELSTRDMVSLSERRRLSTPETEAIARLTARELDVLRCLGDRLSGNQIGALLHISPNTVRTHTQSILHKLRVHSAHAAVALACRAGVDGLREEEVIDPWEGFAGRHVVPRSGSRHQTAE